MRESNKAETSSSSTSEIKCKCLSTLISFCYIENVLKEQLGVDSQRPF